MNTQRKSPGAYGAENDRHPNYKPADVLLAKLDRVKENGPGRWMACCPAHDDRSPSLSIRETEDGTVLIHCFAGCSQASIILAVGLNFADLYPDRITDRTPLKPAQRWVPRDVLKSVAQEALVAYIGAKTLSDGETLSEADKERLARAAMVLRNAAREVGYDC